MLSINIIIQIIRINLYIYNIMSKNWSVVLDEWENGDYPKIPSHIKNPFLWRTSVINNNLDLPYKEEHIEDKRLLTMSKQNYLPFLNKPSSLLSKKNENKKYAIASINLPKDTILVIPKPRQNKNFANIYYFMKNASKIQQKELWKLVAKQAKIMLKKYDNIWISSQGLGISYLHIRICNFPKYYEKSKLQTIPKKIKLSN
jgi:hypothetical protein